MNKTERAKKIEKAILITWDSLASHLEGTYKLSSIQKKYVEDVGNYKFHKKCIKEYAEVIRILSELY